MITKTIQCDVRGCTERQETLSGDAFILQGWLMRTVDDRLQLSNGTVVGDQAVRHYCPDHTKTLTDLHPRVKHEIAALEALAAHGGTTD